MNEKTTTDGAMRASAHDNGCDVVLEEMRRALASRLDLEQLGAALVALVAASDLYGHSEVRGTARDYFNPEEGELEQLFLKDVFCGSTPELVRRWFAGSALRYSQLAEEAMRAA